MDRYDVKCPHCGKVNKDLYLWETEGWYECEHCGKMSQIPHRFETESHTSLWAKY